MTRVEAVQDDARLSICSLIELEGGKKKAT